MNIFVTTKVMEQFLFSLVVGTKYLISLIKSKQATFLEIEISFWYFLFMVQCLLSISGKFLITPRLMLGEKMCILYIPYVLIFYLLFRKISKWHIHLFISYCMVNKISWSDIYAVLHLLVFLFKLLVETYLNGSWNWCETIICQCFKFSILVFFLSSLTCLVTIDYLVNMPLLFFLLLIVRLRNGLCNISYPSK